MRYVENREPLGDRKQERMRDGRGRSKSRQGRNTRESRFVPGPYPMQSVLQGAGVELGHASTWSGHCLVRSWQIWKGEAYKGSLLLPSGLPGPQS